MLKMKKKKYKIGKKLSLPGKDLLRFAGTIDSEELITIEQTINEGCEKVNPDEW